jgi:hypothetical protein
MVTVFTQGSDPAKPVVCRQCRAGCANIKFRRLAIQQGRQGGSAINGVNSLALLIQMQKPDARADYDHDEQEQDK